MFFRQSVARRLQAEYLETRHSLLLAQAEVEAYEHSFKIAQLRVEMLQKRLARLKEQGGENP